MDTNVNQNSAQSIMQRIQQTPISQIADLDFVRQKFIENYNASHHQRLGELMYHRNVVHLKQIISGNEKLQKVDPFSVYACFVTAAVNGYSLDPADNEVYIIPRDGKACLDRQAGAYVRRLIRTDQAQFAEQAKLVYEGDDFTVENGRVVTHKENFKSDIIVAGYVRFVIDQATGHDRYFVYRKSDFDSWRKKSPNPKTIEKKGQYGTYLSESLWDNGVLNGTQPEPNFLRTKIVKHAAKEKCWATGMIPIQIEHYAEVEVETGIEDYRNRQEELPDSSAQFKPAMMVEAVKDDEFATAPAVAATGTVTHDSDAF